jgi:hypothetical protein
VVDPEPCQRDGFLGRLNLVNLHQHRGDPIMQLRPSVFKMIPVWGKASNAIT